MGRKAGRMLIGLVVAWAGSAEGQAFRVFGGGQKAAEFRSATTSGGVFDRGEVVRAEVTHSQIGDSVAVVGLADVQPAWGIGGWFAGGWKGVEGVAQMSGPGFRYGVRGEGGYGESNFGVRGKAVASNQPGKLAYGIYGEARCVAGGSACTRYGVYAAGDLAYTGDLLEVSDLRFKESLAPLERALGKLLALEVVTYEHVRTEEVASMNLPEGLQVGFVAQQVAEVLPELVVEAVHPPARDPLRRNAEAERIRYEALKTIDLIPYLVRAVQEHQAEIEALEAQLLPLRNRLAELEPANGAEKPRVPAAF